MLLKYFIKLKFRVCSNYIKGDKETFLEKLTWVLK